MAATPSASVNVTLIGGRLRSEKFINGGSCCDCDVERPMVRPPVLGASAIDDKDQTTSIDADEAATTAQMVQRSASLVVLANSAKFNTRITHAVTKLTNGDLLISDAALSEVFGAYLDAAHVSFIQSNDATDLGLAHE